MNRIYNNFIGLLLSCLSVGSANGGFLTPDISGQWSCKICFIQDFQCSTGILHFYSNKEYTLEFDVRPGEDSLTLFGSYSQSFSKLTLNETFINATATKDTNKYTVQRSGDALKLVINEINGVDALTSIKNDLGDTGYALPAGAKPGGYDCKQIPLKQLNASKN